MVESVLLSGHLTSTKLELAAQEIEGTESSQIVLIIDSNGGDMKPAMRFVEFLWARNTPEGRKISGVKIYNAESAAAFIALAIPGYRKMRKDSKLGIHRGAVILEANEFDLKSGEIKNKETTRLFNQHNTYLNKILTEHNLSSDQKLMAELYGSNWLRLSAEECLKRGIVDRLF